jgi:hypothetical protein
MAEVECSSSLASAFTCSVFFALVNGMTESSSLSPPAPRSRARVGLFL